MGGERVVDTPFTLFRVPRSVIPRVIMAYAAMSWFFFYVQGWAEGAKMKPIAMLVADAGRPIMLDIYYNLPSNHFDVSPHRPFRLTALGKVPISMLSGKTHGKRQRKKKGKRSLRHLCLLQNQQATIAHRGSV